MNGLAIVSILAGVFFIVIRGPLIFAPEGTKKVYYKFIATNSRIRVLGIVIAALGLGMIVGAWGIVRIETVFIATVGCVLLFAAIFFLLILTSSWREIAETFMGAVSNAALRVIGVISVVFGAFLIYLGVAVF